MVNRDKTWHLWQHCVVVTVSSDREGVKYIQRGALSLGKYMLILRGVNPYFCEYRTRGGGPVFCSPNLEEVLTDIPIFRGVYVLQSPDFYANLRTGFVGRSGGKSRKICAKTTIGYPRIS